MCFLVADGLGGHGDGDLASKEAINVIRTAWDGEISPAAWEHLLELSHKRIRQIQTSRAQMKTTIVGLMMNTERAVWAHVGDSDAGSQRITDCGHAGRDHTSKNSLQQRSCNAHKGTRSRRTDADGADPRTSSRTGDARVSSLHGWLLGVCVGR